MCLSWNNIFIFNFTYPLRCLRVPQVEYHCSRHSTVTFCCQDVSVNGNHSQPSYPWVHKECGQRYYNFQNYCYRACDQLFLHWSGSPVNQTVLQSSFTSQIFRSCIRLVHQPAGPLPIFVHQATGLLPVFVH
jgi:hypothetical protein